MLLRVAAVFIACTGTIALSGCPGGARACSSNADCTGNEVCVVVDGAGTCGTPTVDDDPEPDAGPRPDAGPGDAGPGDAGPDDAGPDDAGPDDAGPDTDAGFVDFALTARPAVGASTAEGGAVGGELKLRARVRSAEVPAPMTGGTLKLSPPRN